MRFFHLHEPLDVDALPDIAHVDPILLSPPWRGSDMCGTAGPSLLEEIFEALPDLRALRTLFDKGYISTDEFRHGLSHLMEQNKATLPELVSADARRFDVDERTFRVFQGTGVLVLAIDPLREQTLQRMEAVLDASAEPSA